MSDQKISSPILVTGATGFLGSHVLTELIKEGLLEDTHVVMRSAPRKESVLGCRFRDAEISLDSIQSNTHFVDLKDEASFLDKLSQLEKLSQSWRVVHLAAVINPKGDLEAQEKVNFDRTLQLLEWANKNANCFIYTSSVVAFGATPSHLERTESDYPSYHWLNKIDGYSTTKRKAHDAILKNTRIKSYLFCPGIVHGKYEQGKNSRAHLTHILEGKLSLVPGGGGSFVSLQHVGEAILQAIRESSERSERNEVVVKLLVDACLKYTDYFQLYRESAGLNKLNLKSLPSFFAYPIGIIATALSVIGIRIPLLSKLVQALMYYSFKVKDPGERAGQLRKAIVESIQYRS